MAFYYFFLCIFFFKVFVVFIHVYIWWGSTLWIRHTSQSPNPCLFSSATRSFHRYCASPDRASAVGVLVFSFDFWNFSVLQGRFCGHTAGIPSPAPLMPAAWWLLISRVTCWSMRPCCGGTFQFSFPQHLSGISRVLTLAWGMAPSIKHEESPNSLGSAGTSAPRGAKRGRGAGAHLRNHCLTNGRGTAPKAACALPP